MISSRNSRSSRKVIRCMSLATILLLLNLSIVVWCLKIAPVMGQQSGSITVRIYNIRGYNLPDCGGTIYVELFRWDSAQRAWIKVSERAFPYRGGENYLTATISNLELNTWYYLGFNNEPSAGLRLKEFWGHYGPFRLTQSNSSITVNFYRSRPYVLHVEYPTYVSIGSMLNVRVTVKNEDVRDRNVFVMAILDRDLRRPFDYVRNSSTTSIASGATHTFTLSFTPTVSGTYILYIAVLFQDSKAIYDQWDGSFRPIGVTPSSQFIERRIELSQSMPSQSVSFDISQSIDVTGDGRKDAFVYILVPPAVFMLTIAMNVESDDDIDMCLYRPNESKQDCSTAGIGSDEFILVNNPIQGVWKLHVYEYSIVRVANVKITISIQSQTGDSYEPDNTMDQAKEIRTGEVQHRSIYPAGDVDWTWFKIEQFSSVIIYTSGPSGDTVIELYDSGRKKIAEDDDSGEGYFSRIEMQLNPGTYYIRVRSYDNRDIIQEYRLALQAQTIQPTSKIEIVSIIPASYCNRDGMPVLASYGGACEVTLRVRFNNVDPGPYRIKPYYYVEELGFVEIPSVGGELFVYAYGRTGETMIRMKLVGIPLLGEVGTKDILLLIIDGDEVGKDIVVGERSVTIFYYPSEMGYKLRYSFKIEEIHGTKYVTVIVFNYMPVYRYDVETPFSVYTALLFNGGNYRDKTLWKFEGINAANIYLIYDRRKGPETKDSRIDEILETYDVPKITCGSMPIDIGWSSVSERVFSERIRGSDALSLLDSLAIDLALKPLEVVGDLLSKIMEVLGLMNKPRLPALSRIYSNLFDYSKYVVEPYTFIGMPGCGSSLWVGVKTNLKFTNEYNNGEIHVVVLIDSGVPAHPYYYHGTNISLNVSA